MKCRVLPDCPQTPLPGSPRLLFPAKCFFPQHSCPFHGCLFTYFISALSFFSLSSKIPLFLSYLLQRIPLLESPLWLLQRVTPSSRHPWCYVVTESFVTWICLLVITFVYLSSPFSLSPAPPQWTPQGPNQVSVCLYSWSITLALSHSKVWEILSEW